jgi:hypothetical protein
MLRDAPATNAHATDIATRRRSLRDAQVGPHTPRERCDATATSASTINAPGNNRTSTNVGVR